MENNGEEAKLREEKRLSDSPHEADPHREEEKENGGEEAKKREEERLSDSLPPVMESNGEEAKMREEERFSVSPHEADLYRKGAKENGGEEAKMREEERLSDSPHEADPYREGAKENDVEEAKMREEERLSDSPHEADPHPEGTKENGGEEAKMREEERLSDSPHEADPYREGPKENGAEKQGHRQDLTAFSSTERVPEGNGQQSTAGTGISRGEDLDRSQLNGVSQHHMMNSTSESESLLYNTTPGDEEGDSRQRILVFAAKRYASDVERNPEDYDALYNWALVLQESADHVGSESKTAAKDELLEEACKKYEQATKICPSLHEAFYNWAIAISDRAKNKGRTKEAEGLWKQACERYEKAVQLKWNSPQAFNNWGLALQELSGIVPIKDRQLIVKTSINKFRIAIQLQFDFHRAIYNLGTVLYGSAEDTHRSVRNVATKDSAQPDLFSQSAIYIAAAHALKPDYSVYRSALRLVHSMLPLPYLKTGYLTVPPGGNFLAPHSGWKRTWFVLDHEALYEGESAEYLSFTQSPLRGSNGMASASSSIMGDLQPTFRIEVSEIAHVSPCADLSLPSDQGFCVDTESGERYLIADTWEAVDSWVDAIRLAYTIYIRGYSDILAGILAG